MLVIGLGHKARHGKNFVAREVVRMAAIEGFHAKEYGFADALKDVCRVQFGMKDKDPQLLQMVGTDLYRRQNADVWVNALYYRLRDERPDLAIITDMRFLNEVALVKCLGGIAVKVERTTAAGDLWLSKDRDPGHPSETALDDYRDWHYRIRCEDGKLSDLTASAGDLYKNTRHLIIESRIGRAA